MTDLQHAKSLLDTQAELTCVLCKGDAVYTTTQRGIAPMMELLDAGTDLRMFSVADRVVGKAAALLFALAGVREAYAAVLSETALRVLNQHGILCSYGNLVPNIINRRGDGPCPMESAVWNIEDPVRAREAIRMTQERLRQHSQH